MHKRKPSKNINLRCKNLFYNQNYYIYEKIRIKSDGIIEWRKSR